MIYIGYSQNLDFVATLKADATNLEVIDFNSSSTPGIDELVCEANSCFGTFGTFGSMGGCFGTFGTYGCG